MATTTAGSLMAPLHVSEEDSLIDEATETEITPTDLQLIAQIREHEQSGSHAVAMLLRSMYGADRAARRAVKSIQDELARQADNGNGTGNGTGNGSNGQ